MQQPRTSLTEFSEFESAEIEALARSWVNDLWPAEEKTLMSVNKIDLRHGFIAGFKAAIKIIEQKISTDAVESANLALNSHQAQSSASVEANFVPGSGGDC